MESVNRTQFTPSLNQLRVNLPDAVVHLVPGLHFVSLASKGLTHDHVPMYVCSELVDERNKHQIEL